jgi:hypothetical protein
MSLSFHIVLSNPSEGVVFGLQKGAGNGYETVQKQKATKGNLHFDFMAEVKKGKSGDYSLQGPFVQGPPQGRFVYIDIGTAAGQVGSPWTRRLKIPLTGISQELLADVFNGQDKMLETKVPGTGRDGGPNCATVKPFEGWYLIEKGSK